MNASPSISVAALSRLNRRRLTKGLDDYTNAAPPHVVAARLAGALDDGTVTYAITVDRPQPLGHITATLDLERCVQRQIRPTAGPILAEIGLPSNKPG